MRNLSLAQALDILEDGDFHSLAYVSADRNRRTGGRIIRIQEGRIVKNQQGQQPPAGYTSPDRNTRKQNHSDHATRNILLKNGERRKMHIYTLFAVENLPVL